MPDVTEQQVQALAEILYLEYGGNVTIWDDQGQAAWETIASMVVAVGWEPGDAALDPAEVRNLLLNSARISARRDTP